MTLKRTLATAELLLILPSTLFMTALFVRNVQPLQYEPAATAQRIVAWYAARPRIALSGFLIAMPLLVFVTGCAALSYLWKQDEELCEAARRVYAALIVHFATFAIAAATLAAACILAIVGLHLATD
jgi:hypothetical protein